MSPAHTRRRDNTSRRARALRWLCGPVEHDAESPPPEEHGFMIGPGESLAQLRFSRAYEIWVVFHNPTSGPTELEACGPFAPAPTRRTLDVRLPIEAAIACAAAHRYDLSSRPEARYGTLLLTATEDRQDLQVLYFYASQVAHVDDPVNRLLDACFSAMQAPALGREELPFGGK